MGKVWFPDIWINDRSATLVKPVDFLLSQKKDPAQDEFGDTFRMSLGISQRKRGAPRSAKYLPAFYAEVFTNLFNIRDQIPCGIRFERCIGRALAAPTLIEIYDAVFLRMKESALFWIGSSTRTAVQENHRFAGRVPAFLEIEFVNRRDSQFPGAIRLDRRIEPANRIFHQGCRKRSRRHRGSIPFLS